MTAKKKRNTRARGPRPEQHRTAPVQPAACYPPPSRNVFWLCLLFIGLLGFIAYSNSLTGKFIWDDRYLVRDNVFIKDWAHIPQAFTTSIGGGGGSPNNFYRPLQIFSFTLDYSLWKLNPLGYHISNTLLHIFVAMAVFWFILLLFGDWRLALLSGLFFVVHPVHTEAVAYISGRADSLSALFILLAFIFYVKNDRGNNPLPLSGAAACFALALCSKESSLIFPGLLLLYHHCFRRKIRAGRFLLISGVAGLYLFARAAFIHGPSAHASHGTTVLQRLPGFMAALAQYFGLMLLPLKQHMEYGGPLFNWSDPKTLLGLGLTAGLVSFILKTRRTRGYAHFGLLWFLTALLPSSNLYPINAYLAEHWLYIPSIGLFLIGAKGLTGLYQKNTWRIPALTATVFLLILYTVLTLRQNSYWKDPQTFYSRTLPYAPESSRLNNDIGLTLSEEGRPQDAIPLLIKAVEHNPNSAKTCNNLAIAYIRVGEDEKAIPLLERAIALKPDYSKSYNTLAVVYQNLGQTEKAVATYKKAIAVYPDYAQAYFNLGNVYLQQGKTSHALEAFQNAVKRKPDYIKAFVRLGQAYQQAGDTSQAGQSYQKALSINPQFAPALLGLAALYYQNGRYDLAVRYAGQAQRLGLTDPALDKALEPYKN